MAHDIRGNPVGTSSAPALAAAEKALWRMMSFYDAPLNDLDAAIAEDPAWLLPRVMKAGFLLSLTEPAHLPEARRLLDEAASFEAHAPARERAHLAATQQVLEGRWLQACQTWDELLLEHPRDALALQWSQLWDFYRGDAAHLRHRPARVLPEWDEADPLHPFVLGLYAFGLEENNLYPQAEETGRRALAGPECVPWAVHAVAHVMEMQGRFEDGAAWLRQHQPQWAEGNGFAGHLWWHLGLFRLEGLDEAGVLRLVDAHLSGEALQITLQRIDAAAMLWRLQLLGGDVAQRFQALVDGWPLADDEAGYYAFNDLHVLVALVGAGELARADRWLARCAERAMQPEDARRSNHAMAREVGLPLMRGLLAHARGEHAAAAQALYGVRRIAQRFGGSHAQRDLIDQTLLAACADGGLRSLGRALLNERLMAKPATPLTRQWAQRLALPERAAT
ncbi:MAG: tetratricopeptide repeat protein [Pseudomonadota bacterium]